MKDKISIKTTVIVVTISVFLSISGIVLAQNLIGANQVEYNTTTVADALDSMYNTMFSNNYSTTEKVVGKWIDGKPVYQKTIVVTDFSTPTKEDEQCKYFTIDTASLSIDHVLNMSGFLRFSYKSDRTVWNYRFINSTIVYPGEQFDTWEKAKTLSIYGSTNSNTISITIGNIPFNYYDKSLYVTIQYTKTTDTLQSN